MVVAADTTVAVTKSSVAAISGTTVAFPTTASAVAGRPLQTVRGQVSWGVHTDPATPLLPWIPFPANGNGNLVPRFPLGDQADGDQGWVMGSTFERDVQALPPLRSGDRQRLAPGLGPGAPVRDQRRGAHVRASAQRHGRAQGQRADAEGDGQALARHRLATAAVAVRRWKRARRVEHGAGRDRRHAGRDAEA